MSRLCHLLLPALLLFLLILQPPRQHLSLLTILPSSAPPPPSQQEQQLQLLQQDPRARWIYKQGSYGPDRRRPLAAYEPRHAELTALLSSISSSSSSATTTILSPSLQALLEDAAERGTGYDPYDDDNLRSPWGSVNASRTWNVILWGGWATSQRPRQLSGCPDEAEEDGACPFHPRCRIFNSDNETLLEKADVVVIAPLVLGGMKRQEWLLDKRKKEKRPIRVLYHREASPSVKLSMQRRFDLQMGVRWQSAILNPIFFEPPSVLLRSTVEFKDRIYFSYSMISHCGSHSFRDLYLSRLTSYLGVRRVHQYGECGDGHKLPYDVAKLKRKAQKYKFYFAFENTIKSGYVTEKLLKRLAYGPIPVYYGSPDILPTTKTPSFINVMDFKTPKALAEYLLFLSENQTEYDKYHEWRHTPHPFKLEFLKFLATQRPGEVETKVHAKIKGLDSPANRRAACCRLCNEPWLRKQAITHLHEAYPLRKTKDWINLNIFNNTMSDNELNVLLLKDDSNEPDGFDE